jgi:hypothetical protein
MAEELDTTQGWCRGYDAVADLADWEHSPTAGPNQKEGREFEPRLQRPQSG